MIIKTETSKAIIDFLKENLLVNLNIIGAIENIPEAEIFVDDVEKPKGVIVNKGYFNYIYSEEGSFIEEFMDTFLKDGFYGFAGIDADIAERIQKKFQVSWENPCALYYLPKENLDLSLIKNPVQDIDLKDVEIIDKYYEFRHPGSVEVIRKDIELRPSSAVYVDGEPACWVVAHDDNSMGIMYTREEHRRKGYAIDVTMDLARKIYDRGTVPYLQIIERNSMSPGLAKKCNFVKCGQVSWFGIVVGMPKEFINANKESRKQFVESLSCGDRYLTFFDKSKQEEMYLLLNKIKENYELAEGFNLKQVDSEERMNIWSNIVCKGYEILDEHIEEFKKMLLALKDNSSYKFYIGYENGEPVSSSALLKLDDDTCGMYCAATLPSHRNKGIGASTIIETLKDAKKNAVELILIQAPEEYISLFKSLGFVTNFNKKN